MKKETILRVINVNQNNEEIDISKITIPENHPFYDVLRNLEGKYSNCQTNRKN